MIPLNIKCRGAKRIILKLDMEKAKHMIGSSGTSGVLINRLFCSSDMAGGSNCNKSSSIELPSGIGNQL